MSIFNLKDHLGRSLSGRKQSFSYSTETAMNLELKRIIHHKRLSMQTPAYTASLYLDDEKVAEISNYGHGLPDDCHWLDQMARYRIDSYFRSLSKISLDGVEIQPDLELWCHSRLEEHAVITHVRHICSTRIYGITVDGHELAFSAPLRDLSRIRPEIIQAYPGITIMNGATADEILAAARRVPA